MKTTIKSILCGVLVAGVALGSGLRADDRPSLEPAAKTSAAKAGRTITVEELGDILEDLGMNPKPIKTAEGVVVGYATAYQSEGWDLHPVIGLSDDKTAIVFYETIAVFDGKSEVPAEVLLWLMKQSGSINPAVLYLQQFDKGGQAVRLFQSVPNQGLTVGGVNQKVASFVAAYKKLITARIQGELEAAKAKDAAKAPKGGTVVP